MLADACSATRLLYRCEMSSRPFSNAEMDCSFSLRTCWSERIFLSR